MAQKLHDQYGFTYDKLQVLLGGWHAWQDAGYPVVIATPGPTTPPGAATNTPLIITLPSNGNVVVTPKP